MTTSARVRICRYCVMGRHRECDGDRAPHLLCGCREQECALPFLPAEETR